MIRRILRPFPGHPIEGAQTPDMKHRSTVLTFLFGQLVWSHIPSWEEAELVLLLELRFVSPFDP